VGIVTYMPSRGSGVRVAGHDPESEAYDTAKLMNPQTVQTTGADGKTTTQTVTDQVIAQGPIASQEAIKEFGTNGGGFVNANSAHPFENPTPFTNLFSFC